MVLGDAVSTLETFVWILNHVLLLIFMYLNSLNCNINVNGWCVVQRKNSKVP